MCQNQHQQARNGGSAMDANARSLVDHWAWAGDKGLTNGNILRSACTRVLEVIGLRKAMAPPPLGAPPESRRVEARHPRKGGSFTTQQSFPKATINNHNGLSCKRGRSCSSL